MDPDYAASWAEAEAITPAVNGVFHRTRDAIEAARTGGKAPEAQLARLDRALRRLSRELAASRLLHPGDREEFEDMLSQGRAVAAVLARLTPARAQQVRSRAHQLVAAATRGTLGRSDLGNAVLLATLAIPGGAEYWNLVRAAHGALRAQGKQPTELWGTISFLAPDEAFGDGPSYPGTPRGSGRATRITGVTSGGLPGLGRRG